MVVGGAVGLQGGGVDVVLVTVLTVTLTVAPVTVVPALPVSVTVWGLLMAAMVETRSLPAFSAPGTVTVTLGLFTQLGSVKKGTGAVTVRALVFLVIAPPVALNVAVLVVVVVTGYGLTQQVLAAPPRRLRRSGSGSRRRRT